jgi:hypothetical protein
MLCRELDGTADVLIHKNTQTALIIDIDELLAAIGSCDHISIALPQ